MKELVIDVLKIVGPLSVALVVFAQALGISLRDVVSCFKDRRWIMLRCLFAVLVLVPAAAVLLIKILAPAPEVGVGLAILAACPPAPLMLKAAPKSGGASPVLMASLRLTLAAFAFVTVPIIIDLVSIPLGFQADVGVPGMISILAKTILIPIALGLAVRAMFPKFADRAAGALDKVGSVGLVIVLLIVLGALYPALLQMDAWSYAVIATLAAAALALGHSFGPPNPHEKTALAVECTVRHPALAITIAAANFSPQKALPVLLPCVLTTIAVATIYLLWRSRSQHA